MAAALVLFVMPGHALASSPTSLLANFNRDVLATTNSDPWLFDDGCQGGTSEDDPLSIVVPTTDPPVATTSCTVAEDAPIVITAGSFTCVQDTAAAAKDECETAWNDPAQRWLASTITVDGKPVSFRTIRAGGSITFPADSLFDVPGRSARFYGIAVASIVRHLSVGTHSIFISFEFADGFAGSVTTSLTVVDD